MNAGAVAFVENQLVENREYLFAELVDPAEAFAEAGFVAAGAKPFGEHVAGHVDVAAQGFGGLAAEEEAVEHSRFLHRGGRVIVVPDIQDLLNECRLYRLWLPTHTDFSLLRRGAVKLPV